MNEYDIALHKVIFDVLTRFYQEHSEVTENGRKGMPITSFSVDGLGLMLFDVVMKEIRANYVIKNVVKEETSEEGVTNEC